MVYALSYETEVAARSRGKIFVEYIELSYYNARATTVATRGDALVAEVPKSGL